MSFQKTIFGDFSSLARPSWTSITSAGLRLESLGLIVTLVLILVGLEIYVEQTGYFANSPTAQVGVSSSTPTPSESGKTGTLNQSSGASVGNNIKGDPPTRTVPSGSGNASGGSPSSPVPAQVLNLANWKLTLPIAKP